MSDKIQIYFWNKIKWDIDCDINGNCNSIPLCPKCHCTLKKSKEPYQMGEYKYQCIKCDFKVTLDKNIDEKSVDFLNVLDSQKYKDSETINLDGELIRVKREYIRDDNYWVDAKISKNNKGQLQLMILAGSSKQEDKAQLFLDPSNERLGFDQNNKHPKEIFSKVVATFKDSKSEINIKNDKN